MDITILVETLSGFIITYGLKVLGAVLILIGGWIVSKWVQRWVRQGLERARVDATLIKFFSNVAGVLVLIIAVVAALEAFGVKTTSFVAVLGAAGLAIGLALHHRCSTGCQSAESRPAWRR